MADIVPLPSMLKMWKQKKIPAQETFDLWDVVMDVGREGQAPVPAAAGDLYK